MGCCLGARSFKCTDLDGEHDIELVYEGKQLYMKTDDAMQLEGNVQVAEAMYKKMKGAYFAFFQGRPGGGVRQCVEVQIASVRFEDFIKFVSRSGIPCRSVVTEPFPDIAKAIGQVVGNPCDIFRDGCYVDMHGQHYEANAGEHISFDLFGRNVHQRDVSLSIGVRSTISFTDLPANVIASTSLPCGWKRDEVIILVDDAHGVTVGRSRRRSRDGSVANFMGEATLVLTIIKRLGVVRAVPGAQPQAAGRPYVRFAMFGVRAVARVTLTAGEPAHVGVGVGDGTASQTTATELHQNLISADVKVSGFQNSSEIASSLRGMTVDQIRKRMEHAACHAVRDPKMWNVTEVSVDTNAKPLPSEALLFVGNPGVGKSSLLNGYARRVLFKCGVSIGHGMTYQLDVQEHYGRRLMDTPGLADEAMRVQAAEAISQAFKQGGNFKLFFVVSLVNGRVRPDDVVTIKIVTRALGRIGIENRYGVIVNQVDAKTVDRLNADGMLKIKNIFFKSSAIPETIFWYVNPEDPDLKGQDNRCAEMITGLRTFINDMPPIQLSHEDVDEVAAADFEEQMKRMEDQAKKSREEQERREQEHRRALEEFARAAEDKQGQLRQEFIDATQRDHEALRRAHAAQVAAVQKMELDARQRALDILKEEHRLQLEAVAAEVAQKQRELVRIDSGLPSRYQVCIGASPFSGLLQANMDKHCKEMREHAVFEREDSAFCWRAGANKLSSVEDCWEVSCNFLTVEQTLVRSEPHRGRMPNTPGLQWRWAWKGAAEEKSASVAIHAK